MKHLRDIKNLLKSSKSEVPSNTPNQVLQPNSTVSKGNVGEGLAIKRLLDEGFELVKKNYRTSIGEIDIIAKRGEEIFFFEVKSQYSRIFDPLDNISIRKQKKIRNVAKCYLNSHYRSTSWPMVQFGAISVDFTSSPVEIEILIGVF